MVDLPDLSPQPAKDRPRWWPAFLKAVATHGTLGAGCRAAKVTRQAAWFVRNADPTAQAEYDEALEEFADNLEEEATRRGTTGKRKSDVLLIVQLKAARPEKYRENQRVELTGKGGKPIRIQEVVVRTRQEAKDLLALRNGHAR